MRDPKTLTPETLERLQTETYWTGYIAGLYHERFKIIDLLREIRNTWQKPVAFNYPKELDSLIELIQKGQQ